jgi:excinuclease UvrABC nuclease subunit
MAKVNVEKLPEVIDFGQCLNMRWESFNDYPARAGVYMIYNPQRPTKAIYIGSSTNLRMRCRAHKLWIRVQRCSFTRLRLAWFPIDDLKVLRELEIAMILKYQPRLNKMYKKPLKKVFLKAA